MSNNRDFSKKVQALADNETLRKWHTFQKTRPVTAHILIKLFDEDAYAYHSHISDKFTEQIAVDMIPYVHQRLNSNKDKNLVKRRVVKLPKNNKFLREIS